LNGIFLVLCDIWWCNALQILRALVVQVVVYEKITTPATLLPPQRNKTHLLFS